MSTYLKKANLALVLILMISLLVPSSVNAAPKDSEQYRASFTKKLPTHQTSGLATTGIKLQWNSINDIFQYRYCYYSYDLTSNVCDIADKSTWMSNGTSTSVTLPTLKTGKTYYWQVFAKLEDNSVVYADGSLSAKWSFTVGANPTIPVGAGTYDNTHGNWVYYGKWAALTATGPYNGTYKESRDIPDYATFYFTGARVRFYYTQKPGRGIMNVYMDSSTNPDPIDQDGTLTYQKSWMSDGLASGNHTLKLVYVSGGYVDIDAIQVFAQADTAAPAQINTITATSGPSAGAITLNWKAVGDDGSSGTASSYMIRYSTSAITDANWGSATPVTKGVPTPKAAAENETFVMMGLEPGETYYFAIRAEDEQGNISPLSNVPHQVAYDPPPAGPGKYDDTANQWNYSNDWSPSTGMTGPYNGTIHYTNTENATASFTFQAPASFVFYYAKSSSRGSFDIKVDGVTLDTINAYAATKTWQNTYTSSFYSDAGTHTVEIESKDDLQVDIDSIQIVPTPAGTGIYDNDDGHWVYSAGWSSEGGMTGPYDGTLHYTRTKNATASFSFQAPAQFSFYYAKADSRGTFEIWVDNVKLETINAYSATKTWQNEYTSPAYTDTDSHTVTIKNTSTAQADVDVIEIYDPVPPPPPAGVGTYDDTDAHWSYSSGWIPETGMTGPYDDTIHYTTTNNATASFTFQAPAAFTFYYAKSSARGTFQVIVDGTVLTTINAYSATKTWGNTYTSPNYTDAAAHQVVIKNISTLQVDIDRIDIIDPVPPPSAAGPGEYDDDDVHWTYSAGWTPSTGMTGPFDNSIHYTTTDGATASFTFQAPGSFAFYYAKAPSRGTFTISVDGIPLITINAYASSKTWQNVYTSPAYTDAGTHEVTITSVGTLQVDVDMIEILP